MPTRKRRLTPADTFAFRSAADAQIAPTGGAVCYLHTTRPKATDTRHTVLMLSRDRKSWAELPDSAGTFAARFSPDGTRLACLRAGATLAVHDLASGQTVTLHTSPTALRELAWSPDGRTIAFQQREIAPAPAWLGLARPAEGEARAAAPKFTNRLMFRHDTVGEWPEGSFQTFVVPADASAPARQVTKGVWWHGMPHLTTPGLCFSADGKWLLMAGSRRADWDRAPSDITLHAVALADGTVRRLTDRPGMATAPTPSPDGRHLAFLLAEATGLSHRPRRLYVMPAGGGTPRMLAGDLDRSIDSLTWTADSQSLLVTHDDPGTRSIGRVGIGNAGYTRVVSDIAAPSIEMPYSGGGFSAASDGTIAFIQGASDQPGNVALLAPSGAVSLLTDLNGALAKAVGGFRAAEMLWSAGAEGRQVQSWLTLPDRPGPHPLVLEIHGGPYAQYGDRFSMKHQMMAAAGYAVLAVNPCGSTGYGEAFANALHDRFPGPDSDDLMAVLDTVAARPEIDAGNLFITGVSGGGVLTLWGIAHSSRFRAAVAIKPVVSWESWLLTADMGPTGGLVWMGDELPWENPAKYRARSPLAKAGRIRTPTLLMAGEADSRTPPTEALQMYSALKLAGVETALLRFPATSHSSGVMRPSLFAAEVAATIGWFERFRALTPPT